MPGRRKYLAEVVGGQVLEEGGRAEDGPTHRGAIGFGDEMLFNLVLIDKVRDGGGIVEGALAAAVDRAVSEELGALLEGLVDESDALATLVVVAGVGGLECLG